MKRLNKPQGTIAKNKPLKWTYQGTTQATMLALAQLGQSNRVIRQDCKLSDGEIGYGLSKAQAIMGLKGGYRRAWSDGTSPICQQVKRDLLAVLRQEVQRTIPVKLIHPAPEVVKVNS